MTMMILDVVSIHTINRNGKTNDDYPYSKQANYIEKNASVYRFRPPVDDILHKPSQIV